MNAVLAIFVACLSLVVGYWQQATRIGSLKPSPAEFVPCNVANQDEVVGRFAKILTFQTISDVDAPNKTRNPEAFDNLHAFFEDAYPLIFEKLDVRKVCGNSLVIIWEGSNADILPFLFVGHIDVVAVAPDAKTRWTYPPFDGKVADGYVWGRGALDMKNIVAAIMEAWTRLLESGYSPERTMVLALGHDEEVGGLDGAACMAKYFKKNGIQKFEMILDEGSAIAEDGFKGITTTPVAMVSTAEKGRSVLEVEVRGKGGHAFAPPKDGSASTAVLGRLISYADRSPPAKGIVAPVSDFLETMAPYAPLMMRPLALYAKFEPINSLLTWVYRRNHDEAVAMVTTTVAATKVNAGVTVNVLPQNATATFDFRTLPGYNISKLPEYLKILSGVYNHQLTIRQSTLYSTEAADVTSPTSPGFKLFSNVIRTTVRVNRQEPIVTPFLTLGATDSRHYRDMTVQGILRFMPFPLNVGKGDIKRVHGTDERLRVDDYISGICTYTEAVRNFGMEKW